MEDKNEKMKEEKKEPKSRFRRGSIYERWVDDEDDFIKCFIQNSDDNKENKST